MSMICISLAAKGILRAQKVCKSIIRSSSTNKPVHEGSHGSDAETVKDPVEGLTVEHGSSGSAQS